MGLGGVAWCLGADVYAALAVAAGGCAALLVERRAACAELRQRLEAADRSKAVERQRDRVAQVLTLELGYERARSVLEALREGVLVVDERGEIVMANPAARRAMREPAHEPVGRILWEALTPELAGRAQDAWDALRGHGAGRSEAELPQIRYSGIPCRGSVYDLTAVEATSQRTGQDFGTVFLLVDSTRTHELQRIKDRFLSNVSHELRTPLTNVCAYAEILNQMPPGATREWAEFARVIHDESVQLSSLVDGLFDYLQLESGEAAFATETFDGAVIVRDVVAQSRARAAIRGTELELQLDDGLPMLRADRRRWAQVVRHLLDNAIKFSPEGGRVRVSVAAREEGFELRIEDNGPGVPARERHAVFEKFNQLRDQLTDKPSGTGIGLATSRAIVARFGGLIWCEDSACGGACFVVLLPGVGQPRLAGFGAGTGAGGGF